MPKSGNKNFSKCKHRLTLLGNEKLIKLYPNDKTTDNDKAIIQPVY